MDLIWSDHQRFTWELLIWGTLGISRELVKHLPEAYFEADWLQDVQH